MMSKAIQKYIEELKSKDPYICTECKSTFTSDFYRCPECCKGYITFNK